MTSKRNFKKKMKRYHKDHKGMSSKAKKVTASAASMILGAGIMVGASTRPVKAAASREDEITEVENVNVISTEKEKVNIEQGVDTPEAEETKNTLTENTTDTQTEQINDEVTTVPQTDEVTVEVETTTYTETEQNSVSEKASREVETKSEIKTSSYGDAQKEVEDINKDNNDKLQTEIDKAQNNENFEVVVKEKEELKTTINGIKDAKEKLDKHTQEQIDKIENALNDYLIKLDAYKTEKVQYELALKDYNKKKAEYIAKLESLGLWDKKNHTDPDEISQNLVLDKTDQTTVSVEILDKNAVKESTGVILGFLDKLYTVKGDVQGDFLKLTYTGFKKSVYGDKAISKIEVVYSDNVAKNKINNSLIYFGNNLLNGFFYNNSKGITMNMKLYDAEGKLITLAENGAYITIGSLNSNAGINDEYIEKAEIINGDGNYGAGVALPESSVTVHPGENGNDILYADKNNELLYDKKITDAERKQAEAIWGKKIVSEYLGWDSYDDCSKEIFGSGLFKVWGSGITIRFSNELGSAWATYSTTIPKLGFNTEKPKEPTAPNAKVEVTPGQLVLNKNSSVHIHYVDVDEAIKNGISGNFVPTHGQELTDQKQSILHLAVGDTYINELWNWEKAGYVLAEDHVPEVKSGVIVEDEKHHYVYLKHQTRPTTGTENRYKDVNQVIHYIYEDESPAHEDYHAQTLHFVQTGTKDVITGEITWGEWTQTQIFDAVKSPEIENYVADRLEVTPYEIEVTNDNWQTNLDKVDKVVYRAKTATTSRDKVVNQIIHYVYEDGTTAAPDHVSVQLVFKQTGVENLATGEVDWNDEWTEAQRFVTVVSPIIKGYHTDRKEVGPYEIKVTNDNFDQKLDQEDMVIYKANPTETINRDKEVNQTVHYVYEDGSQAADDYVGTTLVFTQTGIRDLITGEETWDSEWTETQRFVTVVSPTIKGYHTDRKEVGPYEIKVTNDNWQDNLDKVDEVVYRANPTETISRDKEVNQTVHYVYEDGSQAADDYVAKTLIFTRTGLRDLITGEVTWDNEWTQTQTFVTVVSPEIENYVADRLEVGPYEIKVTNDNWQANLDKVDEVVYSAQTATVSRDKVVNQVIHYVYENGTTAAPDHVSVKLTFTQTGVKNLATGETDWNGEWTPTQTFVVVTSPVMEGYTADRKEVGPYPITVTNENADDNLDKEDTVIYKKNSVDPGPSQPTQPTDPTQPTQPSTPDQPTDPTQPTTPVQPTDPSPSIPDQEEFTPPLPEEEPDSEYEEGTGSEYPDQPEEEKDETVAPHATSDDSTSPEVTPVKAATVSDEKQTPETISTETTEVIEKDRNDENLPETGEHNKSEVAALLGALASALGITGLAGAKRRKKKDE